MGNTLPRDGTAQGVAKVRHYEALLPPPQQLYHDPYAFAMYPGSVVQGWMGPNTINNLYGWIGMTGFQEMISVRTKWLDDHILEAINTMDGNTVTEDCVKHLIILGAGYDTRGFRLDFPNDDDFVVFEVDQPAVQRKKLAKLEWLGGRKKNDDDATRVAERIKANKVRFVAVDFNQDSLQDKLESHDGFQSNQRCVVTLEGVTQYIPKDSTADTLKQIKAIVAPGSTLLITYVDKKYFGDPSTLPKAARLILKIATSVGEPWISGWTKDEFEAFLKRVISDTTTEDYNDSFLASVGRKLDEKDLLSMERFVVAKVLD